MTIENSAPGGAQINLAREAEFALGPIKISPPTLEAIIGPRREIIEPRIMQVLVALVRRHGEVVSRDDLIQTCWEGRTVGDDAINRCIARLRRLAEAEGGFAIETIPRVGYRLIETAADGAPVKSEKGVHRLLDLRRPGRREALAGSVLLVILLIGGAITWLSASTLVVRLERVAVLPFEVLSAQQDVRFFGNGLAEQIIGVLNDNQVQPVSRTQSAALRGPDRDAVSKRLSVDFILDGTVLRNAAGMRVTVHLDRASTHATLWSASFEQAGGDLVGLQSQVAARVVDEVKAALKVAAVQDDAAISAYLKAQEYARESGRTAALLRHDQMRIVVQRAPQLSPGYSGLAISAAKLSQSDKNDAGKLRTEARDAAAKALARDPKNGEAYLALAELGATTDFAEQEALFRKGLAADPNEPTLNSSLAALVEGVGRISEALALHERAVMLDPLSPRKTAALASMQAIAGNGAQARATIERAAKLWPANFDVWLAHLYVLALYGYGDEAHSLLAQRRPALLESNFYTAVTASLNEDQQKTSHARLVAKRAILAALATRHLPPQATIELLGRIGETDAAYEVAQNIDRRDGADEKNGRVDAAVLFRPATAILRRDARFLPLVTRLGLMAYWKTHVAPDFCMTEDVPVCRELKRRGEPAH